MGIYDIESSNHTKLAKTYVVEKGKYIKLSNAYVVEKGKYAKIWSSAYPSAFIVAYMYCMMYSQNGIEWTNIYEDLSAENLYPIGGLAYGNGVYVAISKTNKVGYSYDGKTYTFSTLYSKIASNSLDIVNVWFCDDIFIAVVRDTTNYDSHALKSEDGITWTYIGKNIFSASGVTNETCSQIIKCKHRGSETYIAVSSNNAKYMYSDDLITWTIDYTYFQYIGYIGKTKNYDYPIMFINLQGYNNCIAAVEKADGSISWTTINLSSFHAAVYNYDTDTIIAIGEYDSPNYKKRVEWVVGSSPSPFDVSSVKPFQLNTVFDIDYGNGKYIAIGYPDSGIFDGNQGLFCFSDADMDSYTMTRIYSKTTIDATLTFGRTQQ